MKFYSIVIHNQRIVWHLQHDSWGDAFRTLLNYYKNTFNPDGYDTNEVINCFYNNNYVVEDLDHDNSYTFELLEVK